MTPTTTTLEADIRGLSAEIAKLDNDIAEKDIAADAVIADVKASGGNPLSGEGFSQIDAAVKEANELREQRAELDARRSAATAWFADRVPATGRGGSVGAGANRSAARMVMDSPEFQRMLTSGAHESGGQQAVVGNLPPVEIATRADLVARINGRSPLFAAVADVGDLITPDSRLYPPVDIRVRQPRLIDLITVGTTNSDSVDYTIESLRTDAAAETAYGTDYSEASYAYDPAQAVVRDFGHWTPAHRSNLADEGQIQTLLEGRLTNGLLRRLELQILSGNGTPPNISGILDNAIGSVTAITDERRLEVIHRGITTVRIAFEGEIDYIGLHPSDYEQVVFEKDTTSGQYLLGPASQQTSPTIWGYPTVISTVFTEGQGVVGNWKAGAVLWLRSGASVRISDSHSDFFTKRQVAILAELRAAFACWQPGAFCSVNGI